MASLTAASVSVPSFCGLRSADPSPLKPPSALPLLAPPPRPSLSISASLPDLASKVSSAALAVSAAALLLAGPALATKTIDVGDDVGQFKFTPSSITASAGEEIVFSLVGDTGHNIVFDIPAGASGSLTSELKKASMGETDLLTEEDPVFKVSVSTPGTYTYYCTPHKSANMVGTITIK